MRLLAQPLAEKEDDPDEKTHSQPDPGTEHGALRAPPGGLCSRPPPDLVIGSDGYPVGSGNGTVGCKGKGWIYSKKDASNPTGKLTLTSGTYNFSYTYPQNPNATGSTFVTAVTFEIQLSGQATITDGTFMGKVSNDYGTISYGTFKSDVTNNNNINGGTFACSVKNWSTISGGTFEGSVANFGGGKISGGTFSTTVTNYSGGTISGGTFSSTSEVYNYNRGTIEKGTFEGSVINNAGGTISGGTFAGSVTNKGTIENGTFACGVENKGKINGDGTFEGTVENNGIISDGTFAGRVINNSTISGGVFQNTCSVTNYGTIKGNGTFNGEVSNNAATATIENGTFNGKVSNNQGGKITNGTFKQEVINNAGGEISGGTFKETVLNGNGIITGGTFAAGLSRNDGSVTGGIFNGDTGLTDAHHVTVTNGSLLKVNGVDPRNADGTPGTAWDLYSYKDTTVTITASTDIYSLNDQPIVDGNCKSSYDGSNKTIVKFTMPDKDVVLGTGDLVMAGGYPVGSNNGTADCEGNGWEYTGDPQRKLTLTSGEYDFSSTEPVKCKILLDSKSATITGGTFEEKVTNNGGKISDGTFNGTVENYGGTISSGTFKGTVQHWYGTISGGTFHEKVSNSHGEITGGTFAAGLSANNGAVTGGVFNGNTGLNGVTGLHSIKWDDAYPNAKIEKVNGVSANWAPYVVVTEWTTATTKEVTITADTEIFSLNGKLLGEGDHVNGNKNTVKFTMPDKDVVLNGAITSTDLVMEKGWPKASNEGKISCSGTGWEYIKKSSGSTNTGTLYLMSGSEPFDFNFADPATKITRTDAAVKCAIESYGTISGGIFDGTVTNNAGGEISEGTFKGDVENSGYIEKGTFNGEVTNNTSGTIFGGTFRGQVDNNGKITGGIFAAGLSTTPGTVTGGIFNGNTGLTGAHQVTVTNGSVSTVNDEGPRNADGTWDLYSYAGTTVTITADTEIFSLNGRLLGTDDHVNGNNKIVKFTMPDANVVLNGAITCTDLVMEKGWPKDSNGGKTPCKGDGWEYIPNDPTNGNMLLLTGSNQTGGLFDFSTIGDGSAVECNVFVGKPTAITGGEFNGKVFNNSGILGGTFHGEVDNMGPGRIVNGTFNGEVENNGTIEKGTFKNMCRVINNRTIENGTFEGTVENNTNGTISGGTFAGSVSNNGGTVNGGIFNGNTGLDGVTDLHSITWDAASSNAKIEKVNGVSADWAPYVVTSNATTKEVTITADTEIFSLNGQPIAESSYGVDKKTVTFTMPDDDVVLNGELITKPEPEPKPEPKPEPEPEPEPTTYTVTVIGGTIDGKTSVSAKENDTLTVVLDQSEIPDGMTFDMWSISSSKLSGDINVDYRAEAMTFKMPAEDVTIRAQYRSAEIIEDAAPSPLATAATIAVGGAAAGIVVWQGVNLGVDLYLANALPQGVPVPTDRRALALLLWETAGKPEVALPTLYGDIPAEEIELQKATRWAVQNGLMDAADKKDASFFDPDHYVTKMDVFGAWLRLKKLLGTIGTSPTQ